MIHITRLHNSPLPQQTLFTILLGFGSKHLMIKIFGLNKAYGDQVIFKDLSLTVNRGEKIGLVGRNGHGKSTLFQMILGEVEPDSGSITAPKNYRIGYLEQHLNFTKPTILEEGSLGLPEGEEYDTWKVEKNTYGARFFAG